MADMREETKRRIGRAVEEKAEEIEGHIDLVVEDVVWWFRRIRENAAKATKDLAGAKQKIAELRSELRAALAANVEQADQQRARLDAQFLVIKDMADSLQRQQDALAAKVPRSRVDKPSEAATTWRRSVGSAPAASGTAEVAAVEPAAGKAEDDVMGRRSARVEKELKERIKALEQELAEAHAAPSVPSVAVSVPGTARVPRSDVPLYTPVPYFTPRKPRQSLPPPGSSQSALYHTGDIPSSPPHEDGW
jgi:chromosome segregation ATPase